MLKFAYLESNAKLEFINHILADDGYKPISKEVNDQLGACTLSLVCGFRPRVLELTRFIVGLRRSQPRSASRPRRRSSSARSAPPRSRFLSAPRPSSSSRVRPPPSSSFLRPHGSA